MLLDEWCDLNRLPNAYFDAKLKKTPFTYYAGKGLPELVEEIPLAIRRKMSYHHDGAHSNDGRHFEQLL
jgi:hypothetical protein